MSLNSFFLLGNENYYKEIKELIIQWIEDNYSIYENFFPNDDSINTNRETEAKQEYEYIKSKDSWGTYYCFEIACLIFNLSIGVYTFNGTNLYTKYFLFENSNKEGELMLINYITNYHFELIYDKDYNINNNIVINAIPDVKNIIGNTKQIHFTGEEYNLKYVKIYFNNNNHIYDEIYLFLKSIKNNNKEIEKLKIKYPKMHYNQILTKFEIYYPQYMKGDDNKKVKMRRKFRKLAFKFIINTDNRLCIKNPIKKISDETEPYKIPLQSEKISLVKNFHCSNNHCGRDQTVHLLYENKWYWHDINEDVLNIIKSCPGFDNKNKFKKNFKKNIIIIDEGPHFRYIADLWQLPNEIYNESGYKYIIDIIDHFSKWYYGYLLINKEGKNILNKIDQYNQSFGYPKILQCDNGGEFKNNFLEQYCAENNIKLIFSSPFHPQTNGAYESVHKEIRKYILTQFMNKKKDLILKKNY